MSEQHFDITDYDAIHDAYRWADCTRGYTDGHGLVLDTGTGQRADIGDCLTRHDDGTITVTKTSAQEGLW